MSSQIPIYISNSSNTQFDLTVSQQELIVTNSNLYFKTVVIQYDLTDSQQELVVTAACYLTCALTCQEMLECHSIPRPGGLRAM